MIDIRDLSLKLIYECPDPEPVIQMVFDYSRQSGKNKWVCFQNVFKENNITVVIISHEGDCIGYVCGEINEDNNLFLLHGYMSIPVTGRPQLLDNIVKFVAMKLNIHIESTIIHSDMNPRIWQKWGYEMSPMKIFIREIK